MLYFRWIWYNKIRHPGGNFRCMHYHHPNYPRPTAPHVTVSTDCDWKNQPANSIESWKIQPKPFVKSLKRFEKLCHANASFAQQREPLWLCVCVGSLKLRRGAVMGVMCDNANIGIHENTQPNKWHKTHTVQSHKPFLSPEHSLATLCFILPFFHSCYVNAFSDECNPYTSKEMANK